MSGSKTPKVDPPGRPITALAAMTLVLVFPRRTFERLRQRPHWILPLAFVAGSVALSAVYAARGGFMVELFEAQALRTGWHPSTVESRFIGLSVVGPFIAVPLVALLQALFFKLTGWFFDGRAKFGIVYSAVAYASIPTGIGSLVFAALLPITRSVTLGANLSFLVDPVLRPALWSLTRQVDLFAIWFFVLLGIAAEAESSLDAAMRLDDARLREHLEDLREKSLGHLTGTGDGLQLDRRIGVAAGEFLESADRIFGLARNLQHSRLSSLRLISEFQRLKSK